MIIGKALIFFIIIITITYILEHLLFARNYTKQFTRIF